MKTKKQLKTLSKGDLIDYVIAVERDLDVATASNVELKLLLENCQSKYRQVMLSSRTKILEDLKDDCSSVG